MRKFPWWHPYQQTAFLIIALVALVIVCVIVDPIIRFIEGD